MWKWDQGRMQYFQYDTIRIMAKFIVDNDLKNTEAQFIRQKTGLAFAAPQTHSPWRNYSRIFKLCLLVSESNGVAVPTDISRLLNVPGAVTCDEYIHFLTEATTDPSPALSDWKELNTNLIRSPLCFSLKYLLAKVAGFNDCITSINEVIGAYIYSGFSGGEEDTEFLELLGKRKKYPDIKSFNNVRQARESIQFLSQISYLYYTGTDIIVSLNQEDAHDVFHSISPISGPYHADGNLEIQRLAKFFRDGTEHDFFEYKGTMISDVLESGFSEGSKVKKTHIVLERNAKLRTLYFDKFPSAICQSCQMDTSKKYPWVDRVLDLHHILPLSSGTRVDSKNGTMLDDLVPVCPTCHRAIHRYYDNYLKDGDKKDFDSQSEAENIYHKAKQSIIQGNCYV